MKKKSFKTDIREWKEKAYQGELIEENTNSSTESIFVDEAKETKLDIISVSNNSMKVKQNNKKLHLKLFLFTSGNRNV